MQADHQRIGPRAIEIFGDVQRVRLIGRIHGGMKSEHLLLCEGNDAGQEYEAPQPSHDRKGVDACEPV
jgi:hypothetical protein